jgi:hypothetical protein
MSESIDTFDAAVDALTAAQDNSLGGDEGGSPAPVTAPEPVDTPVQGDEGTPSFLDSRNIDLDALDPTARDWLQAREREMQGAFTRKTQELAAAKQEAEQAVQFLNELNSNPEFALEVHGRLASELERLGYSPQAASAAAAQQLDETSGYDQYGGDDDPYLAKINELEAWKNQQEQRTREAEVASRIDRETAVILNQNPTFTEDDMSTIYGLALSLGGNLAQATDAYKNVTQRAVERYISQKDSVPAAARNSNVSTGTYGEAAPEPLGDLGSKALRAAAIARLRAEGFE